MSMGTQFLQKVKNVYHFFQAVLANFAYGFPSRKLLVIGVTGTNGKTTTCQMIARILEESGKKVAMVSTINFKLGKKEWVNKTKFTTVSAFAIQKFIAEAVKEKCDVLVLETSSHALDQYRVWGVDYSVAAITNVTREHLDYHQTMEEYRLAKLKLFKKYKLKTAVVNMDMEKPLDYFSGTAKKYYGYTLKEYKRELEKVSSDKKIKIITAENISEDISGSEFQIEGIKIQLQLPGRFNIENALTAACVGLSLDISLATIKIALEKIQGVSGRMEVVENERDLKIIIDYALTPDSMEKLGQLISGQKKPDHKLIWVFGSCGDRVRGKRPIMGEIVARYADLAIVANEDPYSEDPKRIIDEVFAGLVKSGKMQENKNCWRILDRREAISLALKMAQGGDMVLVTGKGAEETMAIGKKRIAWNDKKVILEELNKL